MDGPADGLHQMDEDRRWLAEAESSAAPLLRVRLYSWSPPAASLGRHQRPEAALDLPFCRAEGIPIVHRPTGGRAVFHDRTELTYAVVSNTPPLDASASIPETYRRIAEILRAALRGVGVETRLERGGIGDRDRNDPTRRDPCFASASRDELLWGQRKVVGSAQCRLRRAVLQHGSIPLEIDYARMSRILAVSETTLRHRMVSLSEAAGRPIEMLEVVRSLEHAFQSLGE